MDGSTLDKEVAGYVVVLMITVITVVVLATVVILQNKKIREYKHPRYGFLGKPLNVVAAVMVGVAGFGVYYYTANKAPVEDVQVSANKQIDIAITTSKQADREYKFSVVPYIEGAEWGSEPTQTFDVYWTITGESSAVTQVELDLSRNKKGGFSKILDPGLYKIKVAIFSGEDTAEKTITLNVQ